MFLHIFEYNLRNRCQFEGSLPYWDWTLDWKDLAASPIWDDTFGFGGDGNVSSTSPFGDGSHCVTTGPFGGLKLLYANGTVSPHCLSRGFTYYETGKKGAISGEHLRPEDIEGLMQERHYNGFRNMTEYLLHNALHWGLHGDFSQWSSANDPIFYLHHAQLDRLWWFWQQQRPERLTEYFGSTTSSANLFDSLSFMDLWKDVEVGEAVRADGNLLCYSY
ncbi:hypothetical protein ONS95_006493 [Cadophora gregata]|uniref:uncharacterized protein n=1 Tax=Cadophora gregata TaxID=51156 RepID=UPI0026DC8148|nr:uncharacterized protein ONS95_006493 [Cadophora gregata]KAK0101316.1 hypothetical protein ONS95_006493 [Cadophora gregata]KAK0106672.1 hypothetical protein ONS96_004292 [Cadophora gregata f. sp. sojae]